MLYLFVRDGRLKIDDKIIGVDGQQVEGQPAQEVLQILEKTNNIVQLVVSRKVSCHVLHIYHFWSW